MKVDDEGNLVETGFARGNSEHKKLLNCMRKQVACRIMRNWPARDQIGWAYILGVRFERFRDTPDTAPAFEGLPRLSLQQFKNLRCFRGVEPEHLMLVFRFRFVPLGPPSDPFPPPLREMERVAPPVWQQTPPSPMGSCGSTSGESDTESDREAGGGTGPYDESDIEGPGALIWEVGAVDLAGLPKVVRSHPVYKAVPKTTVLYGAKVKELLRGELWSVEGVEESQRKPAYAATVGVHAAWQSSARSLRKYSLANTPLHSRACKINLHSITWCAGSTRMIPRAGSRRSLSHSLGVRLPRFWAGAG